MQGGPFWLLFFLLLFVGGILAFFSLLIDWVGQGWGQLLGLAILGSIVGLIIWVREKARASEEAKRGEAERAKAAAAQAAERAEAQRQRALTERYEKALDRLRTRKTPPQPPKEWSRPHFLDPDEQCYHVDIGESGQLLITGTRVVFVRDAGAQERKYKRIISVSFTEDEAFGRQRKTLDLALMGKTEVERYSCDDPVLAAATIQWAMERYAATRSPMPSNRGGRELIPRDIRKVVWQRDKGRCVQCGADEDLQFDHIIPVSKGGATSPENLQLLCKACNLEKGKKI